jgi:hypothetical protein
MDRLRHLDADRPSTKHEQSARHGLHPGYFTVRPNAFELAKARDGRNDRISAVGENDVVCSVAYAIHLDDPRSGKSTGAAKQVNAVVGQPAFLADVGIVGDHEIAPRKCRADVNLGGRRRVVRRMGGLAGAQ